MMKAPRACTDYKQERGAMQPTGVLYSGVTLAGGRRWWVACS